MENVSSVLPTGKFPEKVENLKPGRLVYPVGTFRTELRVQFTRLWLFIPVPGPRQKHLSRPVRKTKWFPSRLHSCTGHSLFFGYPLRMTRGTLGKLCREVSATGSIPQGNRFGRPAIPVQSQVLAFVWFMANSEVMRSVSDRFNVTLSSLFRIIQRVKSLCIGDYINVFFLIKTK